MLRLATVRNRRAIGIGKISLSIADCSKTDFDDDYFDKVYAINSVYFWSNLDSGFTEIRRILKPGGIFVNTLYSKKYLDGLRYTRNGFAKYSLEELADAGVRKLYLPQWQSMACHLQSLSK
jgi:ubiquinone/menaquinone biosynthesis C-methylase UbiE